MCLEIKKINSFSSTKQYIFVGTSAIYYSSAVFNLKIKPNLALHQEGYINERVIFMMLSTSVCRG